MHELFEALAYDATHGTDDAILAEARERYAAGVNMRGLPRPHDAPDDAWWSASDRYRGKKQDGHYIGRYLLLRWRDPDSNRLCGRSLGRLD